MKFIGKELLNLQFFLASNSLPSSFIIHSLQLLPAPCQFSISFCLVPFPFVPVPSPISSQLSSKLFTYLHSFFEDVPISSLTNCFLVPSQLLQIPFPIISTSSFHLLPSFIKFCYTVAAAGLFLIHQRLF